MNGVLDKLRDVQRRLFGQTAPAELDAAPEAAEYDPAEGPTFAMGLKKKRRTAMLKQMLANEGYSDLAKMISIKEQ